MSVLCGENVILTHDPWHYINTKQSMMRKEWLFSVKVNVPWSSTMLEGVCRMLTPESKQYSLPVCKRLTASFKWGRRNSSSQSRWSKDTVSSRTDGYPCSCLSHRMWKISHHSYYCCGLQHLSTDDAFWTASSHSHNLIDIRMTSPPN